MPLNRYQTTFALSATLLLFVCLRSWAPYPEYLAPRTQIVRDEPISPLEPSALSFRSGPQLGAPVRCSFEVHRRFVPPLPRPPDPVAQTVRHWREYQERLRKLMKEKAEACEALANGPASAEETGPGDLSLGAAAKKDAPPTSEYILPFQVIGTLRVGSSGKSVVIIQDRESGREFHYQEGETHGGVQFRRVESGAVDLAVPYGGRHLRFVRSCNRWQRP